MRCKTRQEIFRRKSILDSQQDQNRGWMPVKEFANTLQPGQKVNDSEFTGSFEIRQLSSGHINAKRHISGGE